MGSAQAQNPFQTLSNALNPKISLIGDFVGNEGPKKDPNSNKLELRETELGFQAEVDPYAKADFFASFAPGETPSFEEGYVTLLSLPWGLRARGGKFRVNFGRLNVTHTHELSQVDRPLALSSFLGADGLSDTGVELSRSFAPLDIFTELTYAVLSGLGEEPEKEAATAKVRDTDGNLITVTVKSDKPSSHRDGRSFAHVERLRFYKDFTDATNLEFGISGLLHQPPEGKETKMSALDMTLRWKPIQQSIYRSFIWRTEFLYSDRKLLPVTDSITGAVRIDKRRLYHRGFYSYAELQPLRRWRFGVRGDYVESPEDVNSTVTLEDGTLRTVDRSITRAISPYLTFTLSEFNRCRVEYQYKQVPGDDVEHRVFFQWTVVLGPHGAHPF